MAGNEVRRHRFEVAAGDEGTRLDQAIAANIDGVSRRKARVLIDLGGVFVDRRRIKVASRKLRAGQVVEVVIGGAFERATKKVGAAARESDHAELPSFEILFEDADLVVVNKPAGLLTAPTPESDRGNLADLLRRRADIGGELFVVHRLDLPTSGVLVFAKSDEANRVLSELFRVHDVDRQYLVVVAGAWPDDVGRVEEPVLGKKAVTDFEVVERFGTAATLLRATLSTGRNHQIRRHASQLNHPVLGDSRYGAGAAAGLPRPPRLALHATRLGFRHPGTGDTLCFDVPLPAELATWVERLRAL